MKVLLVNGSPHREGCTYTALCAAADSLEQNGIGTDVFWIGKKPLSGCIARRAGTTATWDQINKYFGLMQMPIVTSRYWNMVHGAAPQQVSQDLEGLQTMKVLGNNMAYLLKCMEAGRKAGVSMPAKEPFVFTNFIR